LSSIPVGGAQPVHRQAWACHIRKHLPGGVRFGGANGGPDVVHDPAIELGDLHVGVLGCDRESLALEPLRQPFGCGDLKELQVDRSKERGAVEPDMGESTAAPARGAHSRS